jgi:RNA polymerase-binding transcription factor DksA
MTTPKIKSEEEWIEDFYKFWKSSFTVQGNNGEQALYSMNNLGVHTFIEKIQSIIKERDEKYVAKIEEELNKPHPAEMMFDDCLDCGAKINREWVTNTIMGVRNDGILSALSILKQTK